MIKVTMSLVSTAVGLMLLLSFKSHTAGAPRSALGGMGTDSSTETSAEPTPGATGKPGAHKGGKHHPATGNGTFTGKPIDTPYGKTQVAAVIENGKLTNVKVLRQTTDGGRSAQIDASALPILKSEALAKHSADIDLVSGATYTSEGYAKSLQSALDKAGM